MYLDVFVGVDGTGPYSDSDYSTEFADSYVKRLSKSHKFHFKAYIRGPGADGVMTGSLVTGAAAYAKVVYDKAARAGLTARIFLGGYSRGGAAVLGAAHKLDALGIKVHGLLLFDAVDRSTNLYPTSVASNVLFSRHAFRDPETDSRNRFGNCGMTISQGVNTIMAKFYTTHGGMGGTPWGAKQLVGGKINEMVSDRIRPWEKVVSVVIPDLKPVLSAARKVVEDGFQTNVTPEQELKGSQEVWSWMTAQLDVMLATAPKA